MADVKFRLVTDDSILGSSLQKTQGAMVKLGVTSKKVLSDQKEGFKQAAVEADKFNKEVSSPEPKIALDKTVDSIKGLKQQIREYTSAAIAAGENSPIGQNFLKKAGEAKDRLNDLQQQVKNFGSDTQAFDGIIQGATTLAASFSIAQGATALFGNENKDLQKTLIKLQASTAILTGLQQIQNALQKESALSKKLDSIASTLAIAKNYILGGSIGFVTGNLTAGAAAGKIFKGVVTALGGPITAVIAVVAAFAGVISLLSEDYAANTQQLIDNNKALNDQTNERNALNAAISESIGKLKVEEGLITESENNKNNLVRKSLEDRLKDTQETEEKLLELVKKRQEGEFESISAYENAKAKLIGDYNIRQIKQKQKLELDLYITNREAQLQRIKELEAAFEKNKEVFEENNKKWLEARKKQIEEEKKLEEDFARLLLELAKKADDAKFNLANSKEQVELRKQAQLKELDELRKKLEEENRLINKDFQFKKEQQEQFEIITLQIQKEASDALLKLAEDEAKKRGEVTNKEIEDLKKQVKQAEENLGGRAGYLAHLLGVTDEELEKIQERASAALSVVSDIVGQQIDAEQQLIDKKKEQNQELLDLNQAALDDLYKRLELELQANQQGFASNVDLVKAEIEAKKAEREKELADQKRIQDQQEKLDKAKRIQESVNQAAALATAAANIFKTFAGTGVGVAIAAALIAAMVASFLSARGKISQATKLSKGARLKGPTHDEGGMPLYEAEGDEWVVNKRSSKKYDKVLEAINRDNFSNLHQMDLAPLLKGTGVVLNMDIPEKIARSNSELRGVQGRALASSLSNQDLAKDVKQIKRSLADHALFIKSKPEQSDNGKVKVIRQGSLTKTIRKK